MQGDRARDFAPGRAGRGRNARRPRPVETGELWRQARNGTQVGRHRMGTGSSVLNSTSITLARRAARSCLPPTAGIARLPTHADSRLDPL